MRSVIANAVSSRERMPSPLPSTRINGITVPMLRTDVDQALDDARRTRQPHNKARNTFVRSMLTAMRNRYVENLDYTPEQAELSDVTLQLRMNDDIRRALNLAWLPMTGPWLIDQLFSKPRQLRRFASWLDDDDVRSLTRAPHSPMTRSDIPLLDEAMELLGPDPKALAQRAAEAAKRVADEQFAKDTLSQAGIGSGIVSSQRLLDEMGDDSGELTAQRAASDREWTYGHIVVDEAQELTAMDWRMLLRRCPSRSFTIVGDVAQTSSLGGTRRWETTMDRLFGEHGWDLNELTINYRNPQEVSDLASRVATREGLYISTLHAVRTIADSVQLISVENQPRLEGAVCDAALPLVAAYASSDGTGRIAVIAPATCRDALRAALRRRLREELNPREFARLDGQRPWDRQIDVCDTESVKGLEYDAVLLVQPGLIAQEAPSRLVAASDLYVSMTRPTQRLVIVRTNEDEDELSF